MNSTAKSDVSVQTANTANLHRLYILRYIAILGQIGAVSIATMYVKMPLPLVPLYSIIGALALFNLATYLWLKQGKQATTRGLFLQLLVDVLALTGLLYFSGGATNPFVLLYLLPLTIAATALPGRFTWGLVAITIICYSYLMAYFVALPQEHSHHASGEFSTHVFGMWLGFVLSAGLIGYFVVGMNNTLRRQERALAEAREQALRNERLVALGTLAASTAHELGTPLGTMTLLVEEIDEILPEDAADVRPPLVTLREQIDRCKGALSDLSASAGGVHLGGGSVRHVDEYLDDVLNEWRQTRTGVEIRTDWQGERPGAGILADRTLTQALTNILDNAADVSREAFEWTARWSSTGVEMEIRDTGPGLTEEAREHVGKRPFSEKTEGLGLGLFLAHAIIERFGGEVTLSNRPGGGVITRIQLPLTTIASA